MVRTHNRPWIVRIAWAHKRLGISAMLGVAVILALPAKLTVITRLLIGWDIAILSFLAAVAVLMSRSPVAAIRHRAEEEDEGALGLLVLTVAAAMASLGAIFAELAAIERGDPYYPFYLAHAIATVVLSWAFTHIIFALHYAHDFYGEPAGKGCLKFPGDDQPDYWDFIYFAFVIGMTFQVSDVAVTQKSTRRMVVTHGVLSFFFTTAVVALTVNIAAGIIQR